MSTSLASPRLSSAAPAAGAATTPRRQALLQRGLLTALLALSLLGAAMAASSPLRVHLFSTLGALVLGPVALWSRKGGSMHRGAGHVWVGLMVSAAISALFLRDSQLPNIAGYTPIHLLCPTVLLLLTRAIHFAAQGRIAAHRKTMKGLYFGACIGAGVFTLLPHRLLGHWLWHTVLGLI
jgi:uncharacterized membrane protein